MTSLKLTFKICLIALVNATVAVTQNPIDSSQVKNYLDSIAVYANNGEIVGAERLIKVIENSIDSSNCLLFAEFCQSKGAVNYLKGDMNNAELYTLKSLELTSTCPSYDVEINALMNMGSMLSEKGESNESLKYLDLAFVSYQEYQDTNRLTLAKILNNYGSVYLDIDSFRLAEQFFLQSYHIFKEEFKEEYTNIAITLSNIASCQFLLRKYYPAVLNLEKAIHYFKKILDPNHPYFATIYNNLADVYTAMKLFDSALSYQKEALRIREQVLPPNSFMLLNTYHNESKLNCYMGRYEISLQQSRRLLESKLLNDKLKGKVYSIMGLAFRNLNAIDSSKYYLAKTIEINAKENWKSSLSTDLRSYGLTCLKAKEYDQALHYLNRSLGQRQQLYDSDGENVISVLLDIGQVHMELDSLLQVQNLLNELYHIYEPITETDQRNFETLSPNLVIRLGMLKGEYFKRQIPSSTSYLDSLLNNAQNLSKYFDYLLKNHLSGMTDMDVRRDYFRMTESLLEELYQEGPGKIETAMMLCENHSDQRLRLNLAKASVSSRTPTSHAIQVDSLNLILEELKLKIRLSKNDDEKFKLEAALFNAEEELGKLEHERNTVSSVDDKFYALERIGITKAITQNLDDDTSVIRFFVGSKAIYIFTINLSGIQLDSVQLTFPLESWVTKLREELVMPFNSNNRTNRDSLLLNTLSQIYNRIVEPISNKLEQRIIIIPDGILGYLPFDILISNEATNLRDARFLIQDHQVSYQYSASLWLEMKDKTVSPKDQVLAYAPSFPLKPIDLSSLEAYVYRDSIWNLTFAEEEIKSISAHWSTTPVRDSSATIDHFREEADNFRIIHLATHGKADDRMGEYSYLAFTEVSDSLDNKLYVRDLYNMHLNADMVVLSACETGLGELQRGEGILSLARGFTYAGAKSIISSLWAVNDRSTSQIMSSFYKNLANGDTKDAALREAKLDYLNNHQTAHPFYWGAFTAVGDMRAIEMTNVNWYWAFLIIPLVFVLVGLRKVSKFQ